MISPPHAKNRIRPLFRDRLGEIQKDIASAMIGKTVSLMAGARGIAHGMVAGVMVETGTPKIIVNGRRYRLDQVLSVCPAAVPLTSN